MEDAFAPTQSEKSLLKIFVFLALLILPIYANTFRAAWQLDDGPRIVNNVTVHITTISCDSLGRVFSGTKKRFLPYLSFALNWFVGGKDPLGYHLINIVLHLFTAFLLYLTCLQLFQTPLGASYENHGCAFFISFFSAALWAVNPIQTQAVTYIVQRMAVMAAFFYLAGMLFYLKARLAKGGRRLFYFLLVAIFFICGVMSKENAVMLPVSLLLVEMVFFRAGAMGKKPFFLWGAIFLVVFFAAFIVFADGNFFFFLQNYAHRPFTLGERLLTEPRILLFYLSLIFYPLPSRLSISHDVMLSRSLFSPWTTWAAIVVIAGALILSWRYRRRFPLVFFSIYFFFLNHIVESSIIPLELVFEHRNYLPSLFLFLPVMVGFSRLVDRYKKRNPLLAGGLLLCLLAVVIGFGRFTYDRNRAWKSSRALWLDAWMKTSRESRVLGNLGISLAWEKGASEKTEAAAWQLFRQAIEAGDQHSVLRKAQDFGNMAAICQRQGNDTKAIAFYRKGLAADPSFVKNRYDMIRPLIRLGRWEEALAQARHLTAHPYGRKNPDYHSICGFVLLWQKQPEKALACFQKALALDPYNFPDILIRTGSALSRAGYYRRAEWFYRYWFYKGRGKYPPEIVPFFLLIENSERAGQREQSLVYARNVLAAFDMVSVLKKLKALDNQREAVPIEKTLVAPVIKTAFYSFGSEAMAKEIF